MSIGTMWDSMKQFFIKIGRGILSFLKRMMIIIEDFVFEMIHKIKRMIDHCSYVVIMGLGTILTGKLGKVRIDELPYEIKGYIAEGIKTVLQQDDIETIDMNDIQVVVGTNEEAGIQQVNGEDCIQFVLSNNCNFNNPQDKHFRELMDKDGAVVMPQKTAVLIYNSYVS
ncbi:MAG: hypothetical protein AB2421_02720 [Thermotaleaceae bacterium]